MPDTEKIKKLRSLSGAGFKDCGLALEESAGDIDKAIEILRVKGVAKASKKMTRSANEGVIAICESNQNSSILEINCETDFVAKNDDFINFVKELSDINNKVKSNREELLSSKMANNKIVKDNLLALISKIGEKITIGRSKTLEKFDSQVFKYSHTVIKNNLSKLGVIVSIETNDNSEKLKTFGKQLSMHIAASNPLAVNIEDMDEKILDKEQELITEELKNSGKKDEIIKKIALGKINKFKEDNSLMSQQWVMEPKKKVKDILKELNIKNINIKDFIRIKIGE